VYVIEGEPDVWIDGHLHRLRPGDAVGFPAGTGIAHSFLNNTEAEVHLLVVGERHKPENRVFYPLHPDRRALHHGWWDDHPTHALGPHDGMPDLVRAAKARREADWFAQRRKPHSPGTKHQVFTALWMKWDEGERESNEAERLSSGGQSLSSTIGICCQACSR